MMDRYTFLRYNKEEYKQYLFPDAQEYNRIEDIYLACKGILHSRLGWMHPKTIYFRDLYKLEILGNIGELPGVREKYGRLLPMAQIRDNVAFQQKFHEHEEFLANMIQKESNPYCYPAERVLSDAEICFVLYNRPELADYVMEQSREVQRVLIRKDESQYMLLPYSDLVNEMNAEQVQSVPFANRDIDFEVMAVVQDKIPIKEIHYEKLPAFVENRMTEVLINGQIKKLACEIEKLAYREFGETVMEKMRLAFIEKYDYSYNPHKDGWFPLKPLIAYMRNPSKPVKETSVRKNPYTIIGVKYQYDAIQELALRSMAEKREEYFCKMTEEKREHWLNQSEYEQRLCSCPWNFQVLRLMLARPSVKIENYYLDLVRNENIR